MHVHGHCHDGAFIDRVEGSKCQVVNPGSLGVGEYGVIQFEKSNGKWRLANAMKKFLE